MLVLPPILVTLLVPNSLEIVIILLLLFANLERKRALLPQSLVWIRAEIGFAMIVGQNWWQQYHQCCLQWHKLPTIQNYSCQRYSWRLYHQSCPSTDWLGWVKETKAHKYSLQQGMEKKTNIGELKEKRYILTGDIPSFDVHISVRPVQWQCHKPGLLDLLLQFRLCWLIVFTCTFITPASKIRSVWLDIFTASFVDEHNNMRLHGEICSFS